MPIFSGNPAVGRVVTGFKNYNKAIIIYYNPIIIVIEITKKPFKIINLTLKTANQNSVSKNKNLCFSVTYK